MADLPINANIADLDGGFYPVLMRTVPRVGELIHLWLHSDQAAGHRRPQHYEVVEVVHKVYEIGGEGDGSAGCSADHFITVYVRRSRSEAGRNGHTKFYLPAVKKEVAKLHLPFAGLGNRVP
jgi:hypothetical protein